MKKVGKFVCLLGLLSLVGCSQNKTTSSSETNESTETAVSTSETKEVAKELKNQEEIQKEFIAIQNIFTYQDNMIGNLTYNFTDLNEEKYQALKSYIDNEFVPTRDKLLKEKEEAEKKLKDFKLAEKTYQTFLADYNKSLNIQNEWAELMIGFTQENAVEIKKTIGKGTPEYLEVSKNNLLLLKDVLKTSGATEDEAQKMIQSIFMETMSTYGDPVDLNKMSK